MAAAIVAIAMSALQMGAEAKGAGAADSAAHAQRKAIRAQWKESFRSMTLEEQGVLGTQTARYAASGVDVGVGSVATVTQQTRDEYHRAVAADAYRVKQELKGAQVAAQGAKYAQVGGYFSSLASMANSYQQYQMSKPQTTTSIP